MILSTVINTSKLKDLFELFDNFFKTYDKFSPGTKGFELFDATHLSWLGAIILLCFICCSLHSRLGRKKRRLEFSFGITLLLLMLCRFIMLSVNGEYDIWALPLHLCGLAVYITAFDSVFPNSFLRELCYSVCMPGALMALLFCNWTQYPFLNYLHLHCFILHALIVVYPIMLVSDGSFKPSAKRLPFCLLFLVAVSIPIYFLNKLWGTNYMFLNYPSPGSPLEWFAELFGEPGYLLGFPIILAALWALLYIPLYLGKKKRAAAKAKSI